MKMETMTINVHCYYGEKPWVARITGTDAKYGLSREFYRGTRSRSKSGKTGTITITLDPGLYNAGGGKSAIRDLGQFFLICPGLTGSLARVEISAERAREIARILDDGEDFETAVEETK